MTDKNIILFLFFLLWQTTYSHSHLYDENTIFFNFLYIAMKRSEATILYHTHFIEFEDCLSKIHLQILSKMRNPSKIYDNNIENEYKVKQIEYLDVIKKTLEIYNLYKIITNNYTDLLSEHQKDILKKQKELIAHNLLEEIVNLENIIILIKNFFNNLKSLNKKNEFRFLDIKNLLSKISDKISIYFYYQKAYVAFDNLLISQYDYFTTIKHLFNTYYKEFWITIEKHRLTEIINTYNLHMKKYLEQGNAEIAEMIFDWDTSEVLLSQNLLPHTIYNTFL